MDLKLIFLLEKCIDIDLKERIRINVFFNPNFFDIKTCGLYKNWIQYASKPHSFVSACLQFIERSSTS